jgi:hypothetical protein
MLKNKKLCILVKCLQEKLPVLELLVKRRPDLYESSTCIQCKEDKEENQNHLAICKAYERIWTNNEVLATSAAWLSLTSETRMKVAKDQLRDILWGKLSAEKAEIRQAAIKGLTREDIWAKILEVVPIIQEAKDLIKAAMDTFWNGFFENIWKRRCAAVIEWEKSIGIDAKKKRTKQETQCLNTRNSSSLKGFVVLDKEEKKKVLESSKIDIEKRWEFSVEKMINKSWKPFWYGSS